MAEKPILISLVPERWLAVYRACQFTAATSRMPWASLEGTEPNYTIGGTLDACASIIAGALRGGQGPGGVPPVSRDWVEPSAATKARRRRMPAAARKAVSERMRKYWATRRRAKKGGTK